jgi:hypothetical protein
MKTKDYADFAGTSSGRRAETLLLTHKVSPGQIFATVLAEVTQAVPHLEDGAKYTSEKICDPDIWSKWSLAERRVAGMCLAYLVRNRAVPLYRHYTLSGKGTARYCTQPSQMPEKRIKIVRRRYTGGVPELLR